MWIYATNFLLEHIFYVTKTIQMLLNCVRTTNNFSTFVNVILGIFNYCDHAWLNIIASYFFLNSDCLEVSNLLINVLFIGLEIIYPSYRFRLHRSLSDFHNGFNTFLVLRIVLFHVSLRASEEIMLWKNKFNNLGYVLFML